MTQLKIVGNKIMDNTGKPSFENKLLLTSKVPEVLITYFIDLGKLNGCIEEGAACLPAGNYMFKVNNRNNRTKCEICSKLTIKTPQRRH